MLTAIRGEEGVVVSRPNIGLSIKVAKPQVFDRITEKVSGFLIAYKLFIRMKIREEAVEKQIQ